MAKFVLDLQTPKGRVSLQLKAKNRSEADAQISHYMKQVKGEGILHIVTSESLDRELYTKKEQ